MWLCLLLLVVAAAEGRILSLQPVNHTDRDLSLEVSTSENTTRSLGKQLETLVSEEEQLLDNERSSLMNTTEQTEGSKPFKVVCYFTNSAWYRMGPWGFFPEDIDTNLCTHVIYAYAVLDPEKLEITFSQWWTDVIVGFYGRIAALAQKGVKVSLGIGGWTDSASDQYSRMVNNPSSRQHFVQQVTGFIEKYGFTGLDLDWMYPRCWQTECSRGPASDKEAFSALIAELSAVFRPRNWHLSAAVSPSSYLIDMAYDVPKLNQHLDWVNLMAYNYHGSWDRKTGHVAPLYRHNEDDVAWNVAYSVNYWLGKGLAKEKLVMGMPMYGQSFTLANSSNNGLKAPTNGPGRSGPISNQGGILAFYEICQSVREEHWQVRRESDGSMGPYAFKGDQWVGYDDISDIKKKSELIKSKELGGGMIWSPDLDDFRNTCGCGHYPLLTALSSTLNGGAPPFVDNCAK